MVNPKSTMSVEDDAKLMVNEADRIKLTVRDLVVSLNGSQSEKSQSFYRRLRGSPPATKEENGLIDIEKHPEKRIINEVSLDVRPGEVLAILGGSGSGKTTLLNTLSHRVTSNSAFNFKGLVKYNNHTNIHNIRHSYLLQEDSFLPFLTVYETLSFAADLKLDFSKAEKKQLIDSILSQLGLTRIAHSTISCATGQINLSGGERRLVSLAIQLLNKPSLLFLDEPTTGLDANSSIRLLTVLSDLAKKFGIAIVLTIHQPRYEILEKIDRILILAKGGRSVYFGSVPYSIEYFQNLGYPIKENTNLADFLIDLSMKDYSSPELELESSERVQRLVDTWSKQRAEHLDVETYVDTFNSSNNEATKSQNTRISLLKEIAVLSRRTFLITIRDRFSLLVLNVGILVVSAIVGWLFYKPKHNLSGIRSMQSVLYVNLETLGFVPLFYELARLWITDGDFFFKERAAGMVTVPGFLISRRLLKFFTEDFPMSLIFSLITYFMWGLRSGASYFLIYFAISMLVTITGLCCAMLFFALGNDFATSSLLVNIIYQLQNNGCGFFVNAKTMPVYVRWVKYLLYFWYGYGALASNQFTDWEGACPAGTSDCSEYTGRYVLETLGYNRHWIKVPICILLCWAVGFYVAAGLVMQFKSSDVQMSKPKVNNYITRGNVKEATSKHSTLERDEQRRNFLVDVNLENIELWVAPRKFDFGIISIIYEWVLRRWFASAGRICRSPGDAKVGGSYKKLLNEVSADFSAGKVNAILGPSGSGKSTLLNLIAGSLPTKSSNFIMRGNVLLNHTALPDGQISLGKLCSYVTQHDTHLIPTLTVRETLYFQAQIRLPSHVKNDSILLNQKVDDLIKKMGLKDCENIMIGDSLMKGLSGGEKKRVSIAIQLLDDSKIVLLDEPTSGLDSFTATQILKLLNDLALEDNKTFILTIHQPKLDLFNQFGKILLLSRGGNVVYNGSTENLSGYLALLGYPCPKLTNIADHLLDLMSHNINEEVKESQDRILMFTKTFKDSRTTKTVETEDRVADKDLLLLITTKYRKTFKESFGVLTRRQMLTMVRDRNVLFCRLIQVLGTAGVQALFFAPLTSSYDGIANRLGVIQETMNMYYIGFINNFSVYPMEASYFATEYHDGVVDIESFFLAYLIIELPFEIVSSLIFAALVGLATNLSRTPQMFFSMFYVTFVCINAGESLGIMIVTMFEKLEVSVNILSNLLTIGIFMAGTMSLQLPVFFKLWNYISPLKYAVGAMAKLGFEGQTFRCEIGDSCKLSTGEAVLEAYGLNCNFNVFMGVLACVLVLYRFFAYLLLCIKTRMA